MGTAAGTLMRMQKYPPLDSVQAELERIAEAFESRDFHFAYRCMTKVMHHYFPHNEAVDTDETARAFSTGAHAELHKAINAIDGKDFHLAGTCLRKAHQELEKALPPAVARSLHDLSIAVESEDFSTAGSEVRRIRDELFPKQGA